MATTGEFLVRLGHELRTPLTSILGYTEILKSQAHGSLSSEQLRQLEIIERSGQAMVRLLGDVVDWSRLDAGFAPVEPSRFVVAELFGTFVDTLAFAAAAKGLAFSLAVDPAGDAEFETDAGLLRQIFSNLASNAIKFTERGEVRVEVRCAAGELAFAVTDTGPGIAPADRERAFEAFERLGTKIKEGSGLGLSIARSLAERLGGVITLTAPPAGGSRFEVRLPRLPLPAGTLPPPSPALQIQARPAVLVVDDEPDNRELLRQLLESEGFKVAARPGGQECLEAVEAECPGVILLDMAMPGLDGFETARRLRQRPATRNVPIIAITALTGSDVELRTLAAGCSLCLAKPFDFRQLTAAIQRCLSTAGKATN